MWHYYRQQNSIIFKGINSDKEFIILVAILFFVSVLVIVKYKTHSS